MKTLMKNDENVNWESGDALLQTGEVYLKIPAENGNGIVNVTIKGASREMKAKSYDNREIKTGAKIRVVEVDGEFALVKEENI
jgi:membrane-bound ClpP family serine protease